MEENVASIRTYLQEKFQGFDIGEQPDFPLSYYTFTVTKRSPLTQYKLKVQWSRISDGDSTPSSITQLLLNDDVATEMKTSKGEYFAWGW